MSLRSCIYRSSQALKLPTSVLQTPPGNPLHYPRSRCSSQEAGPGVEPRSSHTAVAIRNFSSCTPPGLQGGFCLTRSGEERVVDGESIGTRPCWRAHSAESVLATPPTTTTLRQHAPPKPDTPLSFRRVITASKDHDRRHANKAFMNRQLKNKGLLPINWRIALDLLESYSCPFPAEGGHRESYITVP